MSSRKARSQMREHTPTGSCPRQSIHSTSDQGARKRRGHQAAQQKRRSLRLAINNPPPLIASACSLKEEGNVILDAGKVPVNPAHDKTNIYCQCLIGAQRDIHAYKCRSDYHACSDVCDTRNNTIDHMRSYARKCICKMLV